MNKARVQSTLKPAEMSNDELRLWLAEPAKRTDFAPIEDILQSYGVAHEFFRSGGGGGGGGGAVEIEARPLEGAEPTDEENKAEEDDQEGKNAEAEA